LGSECRRDRRLDRLLQDVSCPGGAVPSPRHGPARGPPPGALPSHGPAHVDRRPVPERWHGTSISPPAHPSRRRRDMSRLWIGTSWKMTKTIAEARAWAEGLRDHLAGATDPAVQPFVIPSFTATTTVAGVLGEDSPAL